MFRSAALKLTSWYLAIIIAISLIFSLALYRVSSADLDRSVNRQIGYFSALLGPEDSARYGLLRHRQLNDDLSHLKANLILFNLLVLIGGGAASYWLARRTLQPIEEALKSQSRFASDASHELRTPLAAIQTENEVALRDKTLTKEKAMALLHSNLEEIAKLKALAEGLLCLANGNGQIHQSRLLNLKDVTSEAISRYEKAAAIKKIRLINKSSPAKVNGDHDSLVELVALFIDNAIKYSPAGSQVKLSSFRHGKQAAIRIADNGYGIRGQDLPHIFERFYRADDSRHKNQSGGYGLGLAIARKITESHQGHIEVTSAPGHGTTFTVFLPAA